MFYLFLTTGIFFLDFLIKRLMDRRLKERTQHPCLGGRLILQKYHNRGAALNLFEQYPKFMRFLHTCAIAAAGSTLLHAIRTGKHPLHTVGLAMLFGGGANNLCDRYTKGHVVDYVRIGRGPGPLRRIVFNLSDLFVCSGAFLAALTADFGQKKP